MKKEKTPITCQRCGHHWLTSSKRYYTNCPNCMVKVRNPQGILKGIMKASEFAMMEHFNLDENGIRIVDRALKTDRSPNGRIIDIFFKERKAWCDYDKSAKCKHIEFALSLPIVQEILRKKGWKLE